MIFRLAILAFALIPALSAQRWNIQYFYDHDRERLDVVDLAFPSAQRGIAVGSIYREDSFRGPKPVTLTTSDGGAHWTQAPLRDQPRSMFFLNDSRGWLVTDRAIWRSEEGGRSWTKISDQKKGLILRVWFLNPERGFAVGYQKTALETYDGGRTWKPIREAQTPAANPDFTAYTHIAFADARHGMIVGSAIPPRRDDDLPPWLAPEKAAKQRQVPTLTLELETQDGGTTWNASTAPLFGVVESLKLSGTDGLMVFEFDQSFEWPSEVYRVDLTTGKNDRVYREPMSRIVDSLLFKGRLAFLAGVEPPGRLAALPIPGKVQIFSSTDLTSWQKMDIDYKAVAGSVVLAGPDADHLWAATDTGMILHLAR
jgi:hypothetical protein